MVCLPFRLVHFCLLLQTLVVLRDFFPFFTNRALFNLRVYFFYIYELLRFSLSYYVITLIIKSFSLFSSIKKLLCTHIFSSFSLSSSQRLCMYKPFQSFKSLYLSLYPYSFFISLSVVLHL